MKTKPCFLDEIRAFERRVKKSHPNYRGMILALKVSPTSKVAFTLGETKGLKNLVRKSK